MEGLPPIHGEDPAFLEAVEDVSRLAGIDRPCLVVGERGTGKELLTSRIHYLSARWDGPLVKINCAALTESLLESELFGHEAGAFTGAQRRHIGRFERAHTGTLVLDEIAMASAAVQEKVLRVIEYGEFERVGGRETISVDVRVIGATNVDLPGLAARGDFRPDLLDRLAFEVLTVPPLRARPADIIHLSLEFGLEMTRNLGREYFGGFSERAMEALMAHHWPGNVRELKNVVERSVYRWPAGEDLDVAIDEVVIDPFDSPWRPGVSLYGEGDSAESRKGLAAGPSAPAAALSPAETLPDADERPFKTQVAEFEKALLRRAMRAADSNQTVAARNLELSYHQLRRLLAKHEL